MTKITRQQVTELIDRLADKTLSFGCKARLHTPTEDGCPTGVFVLAENEIKYRQQYHTFLWGDGYHIKLTLEEIKERGEILGHPIPIGTVLEKIHTDDFDLQEYADVGRCVDCWGSCGFSKSLQQIVEDSGWEECKYVSFDSTRCRKCGCFHTEDTPLGKKCFWLKDESANALAELLISLFPSDDTL